MPAEYAVLVLSPYEKYNFQRMARSSFDLSRMDCFNVNVIPPFGERFFWPGRAYLINTFCECDCSCMLFMNILPW